MGEEADASLVEGLGPEALNGGVEAEGDGGAATGSLACAAVPEGTGDDTDGAASPRSRTAAR
nr:hypothetical protein GCM10020093_086100 [Planobispora longispora]